MATVTYLYPRGNTPLPSRTRRQAHTSTAEDLQRLLRACNASSSGALYPFVVLALTTRANGETLYRLRWQDVDLERGFLRLEHTKNKDRRAVPVPQVALAVLQTCREGRQDTDWVFPRQSDTSAFPYEHAWQAALLRAGLTGTFRFHDLRHTAASYLAMSGASLIEIAEILGHKTLAMVRRYSHFTPAHTAGVVEKMAQQFVRREQPQEGVLHAAL